MTNNIKPRLKSILEQHEGRNSAITARELATKLGSNDRSIRLAIRELITKGLPVASAVEPPLGYFIVLTWDEVDKYAKSIKNRLIEDALRRRDFRRAATLKLRQTGQGVLL